MGSPVSMNGIIPYFWGIPLTIFVGLLLFTLLLTTATLGFLYHRRIVKWNLKYHRRIAITTILIALIHGTIAFLDRFL